MQYTTTSASSRVGLLYKFIAFSVFTLILHIEPAEANKNKKKGASTKVSKVRVEGSMRSPASGVSDSQKSLEIRGQSRNLSMLLVLKNRHENIDFVKPRETYREEIQKTGF